MFDLDQAKSFVIVTIKRQFFIFTSVSFVAKLKLHDWEDSTNLCYYFRNSLSENTWCIDVLPCN